VKIGTSLLLIAVGLVLAYAVDFEIPGIELGTLGSILFFIGLLGLVVSIGLEVMAHRARTPVRLDRSLAGRSSRSARAATTTTRSCPSRVAPRARGTPADDETRRLR
jgi:hypothetical protein